MMERRGHLKSSWVTSLGSDWNKKLFEITYWPVFGTVLVLYLYWAYTYTLIPHCYVLYGSIKKEWMINVLYSYCRSTGSQCTVPSLRLRALLGHWET
jgi:hypothetical protein